MNPRFIYNRQGNACAVAGFKALTRLEKKTMRLEMATFKSVPVLNEGLPYVVKLYGKAKSELMELETCRTEAGMHVCHFVGTSTHTTLEAVVQEDELVDKDTNVVIGKIYATTDSTAPEF
jgi:hypothetical protein